MYSLQYSYSVFLLLSLYFVFAKVTSAKDSYFFYQRLEYPRDCREVRQHCSSDNSSGVHVIKPDGYSTPFEVYCDNQISQDRWMVIQRQVDGSVSFKRNWEDYRNGFGFLSSEFYIGNEKLSYLTNQAVCELRIDMVLTNGSSFYVKYSSFRISDEWGQYALVKVEDFIGKSSCVATSCPREMDQENCSCETTCRDPIGMTDCREVCVETCTPKRCFVNETDFISNGESYVAAGCIKRCFCAEGQLTCNDNYTCDPSAVCERRNNELQCYCNAGYSGDGVNCTSICQANEVYGTCSCQKSCSDPTGCVSCNQGNTCYCPYGFYLQGSNCIRQEECGCFIDGRVLQNGETYVNPYCSRRCTCNNDRLNCDHHYRCSSYGACRVRNGVRQCYCNEGYRGDGQSCTRLRDCNDVWNYVSTQNGVYYIRPNGWNGSPFNIYCNGGWTVFQRRRDDGNENFYRSWNSYRDGFGDIRNEFWLGNEKLHCITQQGNYELLIDYADSYFNHYNDFRIGNEGDQYRITHLGSHYGFHQSLKYSQNIAFSTYDRDNDGVGVNCAEGHRSGWWHGGHADWDFASSYCDYFPHGWYRQQCSTGNLNGDHNGIEGKSIYVYYIYCNMGNTEMKIRRK